MACFSSDVKGTGQEACWSVECAHCAVLLAHCPACLPTCTGQLPVKQRGAAAAASGGNLELSEFEESDSEEDDAEQEDLPDFVESEEGSDDEHMPAAATAEGLGTEHVRG